MSTGDPAMPDPVRMDDRHPAERRAPRFRAAAAAQNRCDADDDGGDSFTSILCSKQQTEHLEFKDSTDSEDESEDID